MLLQVICLPLFVIVSVFGFQIERTEKIYGKIDTEFSVITEAICQTSNLHAHKKTKIHDIICYFIFKD